MSHNIGAADLLQIRKKLIKKFVFFAVFGFCFICLMIVMMVLKEVRELENDNPIYFFLVLGILCAIPTLIYLIRIIFVSYELDRAYNQRKYMERKRINERKKKLKEKEAKYLQKLEDNAKEVKDYDDVFGTKKPKEGNTTTTTVANGKFNVTVEVTNTITQISNEEQSGQDNTSNDQNAIQVQDNNLVTINSEVVENTVNNKEIIAQSGQKIEEKKIEEKKKSKK